MIFAQSKAKTFGEICLFIWEEINLGIEQMQSFKALIIFFKEQSDFSEALSVCLRCAGTCQKSVDRTSVKTCFHIFNLIKMQVQKTHKINPESQLKMFQ